MRASTWATLWSSPRLARHHSLRHTALSHWSSSRRRAFHYDVTHVTSIHDSADDPKANTNGIEGSNATQSRGIEAQGTQSLNNGSGSGSNNGSGSPKPRDPSNYGSASNRARRNRLPKELPPVHIPDWFLENNVMLAEDMEDIMETIEPHDPPLTEDKSSSKGFPQQTEERIGSTQALESVNIVDMRPVSKRTAPPGGDPDIRDILKRAERADVLRRPVKKFPASQSLSGGLCVPRDVFREVAMMISASMILPPPRYADIALDNRSHMIIYSPTDGASKYLIQIIQEWSFSRFNFDYLRLDAQDIAEIGGNYMEDAKTFEPGTLSSLGYDISFPATFGHEQASGQPDQGESFDDGSEGEFPGGDKTPSDSRPYAKSSPQRRGSDVGMGVISVGALERDVREAFRSLVNNNFTKGPSSFPSNPSGAQASQDLKDNTDDLKMGLLVETLLSAPEKKIKAKGYTQVLSRPPSGVFKPEYEMDQHVLPDTQSAPRPVSKNFIVFVEDYLQINATHHGSKFLDKLQEVVAAKRSEGKRVIVIGVSSSREMMPAFSKSSVNDMQAGQNYEPVRTIVVPVMNKTKESDVLTREHKCRISRINFRHVQDMIRRLAPAPEQRSSTIHTAHQYIGPKVASELEIEDSIWPMDRISRVGMHALGNLVVEKDLQNFNLTEALKGIHKSDQAKYQWVKERREMERKTHEKPQKRGSDMYERLQKLSSTFNKHEKRLLNGVIDANSIKTTFADIQAPKETIDALTTLTSMSLVRPDAFTYGVLASDRIPGLLLYGPPGTGKTLLAKAVAKECASTMLEVSGSSIYDMYVGESEKNVRAIFSLAKKLAPCVVFIDEADAILGSRSASSSRNVHRDLINQFLREWDGMTESNAFVMVATNRPFDLDDASLRRLPRRLLVDLPVEQDREAILKIHLKDEILDADVSLSKLASQTPFYSGSDLKNVCVAAALACVREEVDMAVEHNGKLVGKSKDALEAEKYKFAEKRTLCVRHFDKGLDEVSASISQDMSSLNAIRKFDEQYGDRKGRRKKLGSYGFKTVEETEKKGSDALRVRNQELP